MLLSQCLRSSCELRPLPRIRCPAWCRARRFIPYSSLRVRRSLRGSSRGGASGGESGSVSGSVSSSSSDRRVQMWRADCGEESWRADVVCKQILTSSSPSMPATRTCRADVPSRRAAQTHRADHAERVAPMGSRRASVALCWSRRAGHGERVTVGLRRAGRGGRGSRPSGRDERSWRALVQSTPAVVACPCSNLAPLLVLSCSYDTGADCPRQSWQCTVLTCLRPVC
jgi:hypothetical protein